MSTLVGKSGRPIQPAVVWLRSGDLEAAHDWAELGDVDSVYRSELDAPILAILNSLLTNDEKRRALRALFLCSGRYTALAPSEPR